MTGMKIILIVVLLAVFGAGAYWAGSRADNRATQTSQPTSTDSDSRVNQVEPGGLIAGTITMRNNMFTPPQIEVPKGGTVEWVNNDDTPHTVIADQGEGPASREIPPGGTYRYTFKESGSVQYHCGIHPEMRGTIVVK